MKPFSAEAAYEIARSFEQLRAACNFFERAGMVKFSGGQFAASEAESVELLTGRTRREFFPEWGKSILSILTSVEKHCEDIGLKLAAKGARDYRAELESGSIKTYSDASDAIGTLDKIIRLELRENLFMFIPPDRAAFYAKPQLFGEAVNRRFLRACMTLRNPGIATQQVGDLRVHSI
jgi:hypothetical protein